MPADASKPLTVTVCTGTTCSLMDGAALLDLEAQLPPSLQGRVRVRGARCLEQCHRDHASEAPFVLVEGACMGRATIPGVIARLEALLAERE